MRYRRPLLVLALILPVKGQAQARQGGAWQVDQPSLTLELEALDVIRSGVVTFRPALYLRCFNEKLEAFVATGAPGKVHTDYRTTVRLRWADRPALEETWSRSTDYSAVFAPNPASFVRELLATPKMTFEFRPADADPVVARFDGTGLGAHLPTLRTRCGGFSDTRGARLDSVYADSTTEHKAELISLPKAQYPPLLRRAGIRGTVIVQAIIDTLGRVVPGSLRVISSPNSGLNSSALHAAEQAVFRPARVQGHPVRTRLRLSIDFKSDSP